MKPKSKKKTRQLEPTFGRPGAPLNMAEFGWIMEEMGKLKTIPERVAAAPRLCAEIDEWRKRFAERKVFSFDDYYVPEERR
jgi:hypothetical protein